MTGFNIANGKVLRDGSLVPGAVGLRDGLITEAGGGTRFDATGLNVLPGIVDLHGDAHERALQPRTGVDFDAAFALRDSSAQIIASGITTACLGITLSWEPGLRSIGRFRDLLTALTTPPPGPELRVHLRFEADNLGAEVEAVAAIEAGAVHVLGFNDHTPGILRKLGDAAQLGKYAGRAGVAPDTFLALAECAAAARGAVPESRARMAAAARASRVPMLSHDDASVAERAAFRALGASICEFPMARDVAEAAHAAGEAVVMGAPNVVRGGSHLGWASAAPLAEAGLVTVLASDYHWPALLEAPFRLAARGRLDLAAAWALVSENPARALGLGDRGRIAEGLRGDLVLVTPDGVLVAAFVAGALAWLAPGAWKRIGR